MALIPVLKDAQRRQLHSGDKGNDVLAYGRMLARTLKKMGLITVNAHNGYYGQYMLVDTLRLQHALGLHPDGIVGPATWHAVDAQMHTWERLLLKAAPKPKPVKAGVKIAHMMRVFLAHAGRAYGQGRPAARTLAAWLASADDCSGTALLALSLALGIPWDGYGYTGSMWEQGIAVSEADREPGDMVFYGDGRTTEHVAVYDGLDKETIGTDIGHGRSGGPFRNEIRYRPDVMGYRRLAA